MYFSLVTLLKSDYFSKLLFKDHPIGAGSHFNTVLPLQLDSYSKVSNVNALW